MSTDETRWRRPSDYDNHAEVQIMRLPTILFAAGLICCPALTAIAQEGTPSAATQPEEGAEVLGTVVRGNTTIIFHVTDGRLGG
jgi:hypothetical protein